MDERTSGTSGQGQTSGQSQSKKTATQTIKSGESGSLSGYMVASGEDGAMACQVGETVFEGDYQGSEGDPCTVNISVE